MSHRNDLRLEIFRHWIRLYILPLILLSVCIYLFNIHIIRHRRRQIWSWMLPLLTIVFIPFIWDTSELFNSLTWGQLLNRWRSFIKDLRRELLSDRLIVDCPLVWFDRISGVISFFRTGLWSLSEALIRLRFLFFRLPLLALGWFPQLVWNYRLNKLLLRDCVESGVVGAIRHLRII